MNRRTTRALLLCATVLAGAALVRGSLRLINPSNGAPLHWSNPAAISVVIHDAGSDDIADGSHETALRMAIDAWNDVDGSGARLVEDLNPAHRAAGDWTSPAHHVLRFDETNASGYFPFGSSTVAITPVWFTGGGTITDADVLFNGYGFGFTTSGEAGRYDVQDVAAHELGHLLGFDHSGQAGATLYPYVDSQVILHRSLSRDDEQALRAVYPDRAHGAIRGRVERTSDSTGVPGAHVVARDADGRTRGGTIADGNGNFTIGGFDAGTYDLVVVPLDQPVSAGNLTPGHVVESNFGPAFAGPFALADGQTIDVGTIGVGSDVTLNLGTSADQLPLRAVRGATTFHQLRGSQLVPGSTLTASDPDVVVQVTAWSWSRVSFRLQTPAGEPRGHFDLRVTDSMGRVSVLPAAVEVTPPDPVVAAVTPAQGDKAGGGTLTILGSDFAPGCRVVLAGEVYEDGVPGGCTRVDDGTITLTTRQSVAGTWDVVVIDESGVEGRLADGFQFTTIPTIASVFPPAGDDAGGTLVTIKGDEFVDGCVVSIGGVVQATTAVLDSRTILLQTQASVAGGPYELRVENPGGAFATSNFAYAAPPDPGVTSVDPGGGSAMGGEVIRITGVNFAADTRVVFGADPETGLGGHESPEVVVVSSGELDVRTPGVGYDAALSVLARSESTGQASVVAAAFTTAGSGGDGGGSCHAVPVDGPPDPRDVARTLAFFVLLALGARLVRPARRPAPAGVAAA